MRIAVSSQNFRSITGHAGKARRFMVFENSDDGEVREVVRFDLPPEMAMHGFDDSRTHPLDGVNVLITASCGEGFARRMQLRGVRVVVTGANEPAAAVRDFLAGSLAPPPDDGEEACGCHD